ncbi:helix-turn-helix domain-containing protein [Streptococcus sp. E24BD]|uniref:helix-turn-helix domain-containing protein n=1 Tax=Streptococcus sp. E24BD TaxID=3278715 RepID=UPI00359E92D3
MNKFAEQLKDFRHQKGLSQDDLANQLHLSRQAISRWENGETAPDLDTLVKLSSIFEVTLDELATGIKPEPVIVEKVVEVEKEFKIPAEFHQHQGYGKMNVWDFLADYWWVIIPILGYIGWILGK